MTTDNQDTVKYDSCQQVNYLHPHTSKNGQKRHNLSIKLLSARLTHCILLVVDNH